MSVVIMLRDGKYWIGFHGDNLIPQTTGNIDAATKYDSRWLALTAINKVGGGVMHMASIVDYKRPSEREAKPPERGP